MVIYRFLAGKALRCAPCIGRNSRYLGRLRNALLAAARCQVGTRCHRQSVGRQREIRELRFRPPRFRSSGVLRRLPLPAEFANLGNAPDAAEVGARC